jgi:hypothetical protein
METTRMSVRIKSLLGCAAVTLITSSQALAQLPSSGFQQINTFARAFGFGYSDGYHECPKQEYQQRSAPHLSLEPSQLFETATMPGGGGFFGHHGQPNQYAPGCSTCGPSTAAPVYVAPMNPGQAVPAPVVPNAIPSLPQVAPYMAPTPMTQLPPQLPPSQPNTFSPSNRESVDEEFLPLDEAPAEFDDEPTPFDRAPSKQLDRNPAELEEIPAEPDSSDDLGSESDEDLLLPDEPTAIWNTKTHTRRAYRPSPINRYMR